MGALKVEVAGDGVGGWTSAARPLRGPLAVGADLLQGYEERGPGPVERREGPVAKVVVIVDLGPGLEVAADPEASYARFARGFVAGLSDRAARTRHAGIQRGVQLNLDPVTAHRVFGVPMHELAGRVIDLDDLLPTAARGLAARIGARGDWAGRLDEVERTLTAQALQRNPADVGAQVVEWATACIVSRGGRVDVGRLAEASGYSHKHLLRLFRQHAGLSPKRVARIARLDALRRSLAAGGPARFAELAAAHGFTDQAHLSREVRAMTGLTPSAWRGQVAPTSENAKPEAAEPR